MHPIRTKEITSNELTLIFWKGPYEYLFQSNGNPDLVYQAIITKSQSNI